MKFKLVKSNSCSSRLELAGTGLTPESKDNIESIKKIIHNRTNTPSPLIELNEQEETVRDMIYKLEGKNVSLPTKPRIIESKCIEKIPNVSNDGSSGNNQMHLETKVEHLQHNIIESEIAERLLLEDNIKTNKTVNNHISVINAAQQHNSTDTRKELQTKSMKIVRNINVDLALPLLTNATNNKPIKDRENLARKASLSPLLKASSKENINENTDNNEFKLTKWHSIGKLESIEMVKNQDKRNQANDTSLMNINKNNNNENANNKMPPPALKSSNSPSANKTTKMVNWSTVGKLDKEYIANDRRLIETKKYDEMEFEQFEVLGEHYDSLNSK